MCRVAPQVKRQVNRSSFSLLYNVAQNKHEQQKVSCFSVERNGKSTNVNLLYCLVCLMDKNGRFSVMIGQDRLSNKISVKGQLVLVCDSKTVT